MLAPKSLEGSEPAPRALRSSFALSNNANVTN